MNEPGKSGARRALDQGPQAPAQRALMHAKRYLYCLGLSRDQVKGKRILELGPGKNLGHALLLAGLGAELTVLDSRPLQWEDSFHPTVYGELAALAGEGPDGPWPTGFLQEACAKKTHRVPGISLHCLEAEALESVSAPGTYDIVVSNSVLEHVRGLRAAVRAAFACSRHGAVAHHTVDFRDHRDFSRPLEFLLEDDRLYEAFLNVEGTDRGTRVRFSELIRHFKEAGYLLRHIKYAGVLDSSYLARLREEMAERGKSKRYARCGMRDLSVSSAEFTFYKP